MTRILVIEDEELIRMNITETLHYEGYSVLEAADGRDGVEKAKQHLPELIICDIMMPKLDGYGVLLELQNEPVTANIPFVFLTAKTDQTSLRQGMTLGADDYLMKPFTADALLVAIEARLTKQRRLEDEYAHKLETLRNSIVLNLPHELRTPLSIIAGYTDLIVLDGDTMPREDIIEMAKNVRQASTRLHHLIEQYLIYAQIQILKMNPEEIDTHLTAQVENVEDVIANIVNDLARKYDRQADIDVTAANATLAIERESFTIIIREIIDNAFKFSEAGDIVRISGEQQGSFYTMTITDHGRGMTQGQIQSVGAYQQFDRHLYEQQGAGFGIANAQQLTDLHRGTFNIHSEPDIQTTVTIQLPIHK